MAMNMDGGAAGDDSYGPIAEINMIPLIDVMLVLLIISMITTPFLEQGVNVELPVTGSGQNLQKAQAEEPVTLLVSKDRNLRLGSVVITRAELPAKLAAIFKNRTNRELFVRADKDVPYGIVVDVMARVQAAGVERVGLVTQPE